MADKDRQGAGHEKEIEITPEMLAAGVEVFCAADLRFESEEDVVADTFRAMISRQRRVAD